MNSTKTEVKIEKNKINVSYTIVSLEEKSDDNIFYCLIPGFDLVFSSSKQNIQKYGKILVKAYFSYYLKNESFNSLILELHRSGFKTNQHSYTLKQLLNKKENSAKFSISQVVPSKYKYFENFNTVVN